MFSLYAGGYGNIIVIVSEIKLQRKFLVEQIPKHKELCQNLRGNFPYFCVCFYHMFLQHKMKLVDTFPGIGHAYLRKLLYVFGDVNNFSFAYNKMESPYITEYPLIFDFMSIYHSLGGLLRFHTATFIQCVLDTDTWNYSGECG